VCVLRISIRKIITRYLQIVNKRLKVYLYVVLRADRLRSLREQQGWSQRELAKRCGFSDALIRKYESENIEPSVPALKKVAEELKVSVDYLLGMSDDPSVRPKLVGLDETEIAMIENYRRDGWIGVLSLVTEKLKQGI
jgi:transcriptional regulator with XRE-family HTH domain